MHERRTAAHGQSYPHDIVEGDGAAEYPVRGGDASDAE